MWALVVTYGMRWKVEGAFSTIKRILGERVGDISRGDVSGDADESEQL